MELAKESIEGLNQIDELDEANQIENLVAGSTEILCRREGAQTAESIIDGLVSPTLNAEGAKQLYASICSLLIEGAKADCSVVNMMALLEESGIITPLAQRLADSIEIAKPKLRWMLKCTGFGQRSIVDLKWRLDYHVRSSTTGVEHVPVYFVSLKTVVGRQ